MTNTIDIENINRYIEHHIDKGCELFPECALCPFNDCFNQVPRVELLNKREAIREGLRGLNKVLRRKELWTSWK